MHWSFISQLNRFMIYWNHWFACNGQWCLMWSVCLTQLSIFALLRYLSSKWNDVKIFNKILGLWPVIEILFECEWAYLHSIHPNKMLFKSLLMFGCCLVKICFNWASFSEDEYSHTFCIFLCIFKFIFSIQGMGLKWIKTLKALRHHNSFDLNV